MADKTQQLGQLTVAVQDLLCELRIRPEDLRTMAAGYSPDYPGGRQLSNGGSTCKIQISSVVAQKLVDAGVIPG